MAQAEVDARQRREVTLSSAIVLLALQAGAMVFFGWLLWSWSEPPRSDFLTFSLFELVLGGAVGAGFIALALALFKGFPQFGERMIRLQAETYAFLGPRLGWPSIVVISLCAGVGEEALFRGGMQNLLANHSGSLGAILVSSAAFAALHLGKPVITALLFVVGAIFGAIYWMSGSLLAVMIGHAVYDIWALRYLHTQFVKLGLFEQSGPYPT